MYGEKLSIDELKKRLQTYKKNIDPGGEEIKKKAKNHISFKYDRICNHMEKEPAHSVRISMPRRSHDWLTQYIPNWNAPEAPLNKSFMTDRKFFAKHVADTFDATGDLSYDDNMYVNHVINSSRKSRADIVKRYNKKGKSREMFNVTYQEFMIGEHAPISHYQMPSIHFRSFDPEVDEKKLLFDLDNILKFNSFDSYAMKFYDGEENIVYELLTTLFDDKFQEAEIWLTLLEYKAASVTWEKDKTDFLVDETEDMVAGQRRIAKFEITFPDRFYRQFLTISIQRKTKHFNIKSINILYTDSFILSSMDIGVETRGSSSWIAEHKPEGRIKILYEVFGLLPGRLIYDDKFMMMSEIDKLMGCRTFIDTTRDIPKIRVDVYPDYEAAALICRLFNLYECHRIDPIKNALRDDDDPEKVSVERLVEDFYKDFYYNRTKKVKRAG